jgi:hypothetical protein
MLRPVSRLICRRICPQLRSAMRVSSSASTARAGADAVPGRWNTGRSLAVWTSGRGSPRFADTLCQLAKARRWPGRMVMSVASTSGRRTRRKAGRSSILRDEQGRWQGFVSMGRRPDGRRDRRHVRGRTRAEITVKVRAWERQRDGGLPLASGRVPTVGEWVRFWLDHIAVHRLRPGPGRGTGRRRVPGSSRAWASAGWTGSRRCGWRASTA